MHTKCARNLYKLYQAHYSDIRYYVREVKFYHSVKVVQSVVFYSDGFVKINQQGC